MKKFIIALLLLFLFSGCVSKPSIKDIDRSSITEQRNNDVTMIPSTEPKDGAYDLSKLNIVLPVKWHLDTKDQWEYRFVDDNGKNKGWITVGKYGDNAFSEWQPNHSEIIKDELINIPLGKCKVFTLDADNGTAASGIIGTHNDYYAIIPVKDNIRYILEFSQNDKSSQTKEKFVEILKELSFIQ
jgi:hypothetical protein